MAVDTLSPEVEIQLEGTLDGFVEMHAEGEKPKLVVENVVDEARHIEALVAARLIDQPAETPLSAGRVKSCDSMTVDRIQSGMQPLNDRVSLACIPGQKQLFIVDGFHRLASLRRCKVKMIQANIVEMSHEEAYDWRIHAQSKHDDIQIGRLSEWVNEIWGIAGPYRDRLTAQQAFMLHYSPERFKPHLHNLDEGQFAEVQTWIDHKMEKWNLEVSTQLISKFIEYREVLDIDIISAARGYGEYSGQFLDTLAKHLADKPEHQQKASELRLLYGPSMALFDKICTEIKFYSVDMLGELDYNELLEDILNKERHAKSFSSVQAENRTPFNKEGAIGAATKAITELMDVASHLQRNMPEELTEAQIDRFKRNYRDIGKAVRDLAIIGDAYTEVAEHYGIELEREPHQPWTRIRVDPVEPLSYDNIIEKNVTRSAEDSNMRELMVLMISGDLGAAVELPAEAHDSLVVALEDLQQSPVYAVFREPIEAFEAAYMKSHGLGDVDGESGADDDSAEGANDDLVNGESTEETPANPEDDEEEDSADEEEIPVDEEEASDDDEEEEDLTADSDGSPDDKAEDEAEDEAADEKPGEEPSPEDLGKPDATDSDEGDGEFSPENFAIGDPDSSTGEDEEIIVPKKRGPRKKIDWSKEDFETVEAQLAAERASIKDDFTEIRVLTTTRNEVGEDKGVRMIHDVQNAQKALEETTEEDRPDDYDMLVEDLRRKGVALNIVNKKYL